MEAQLEYMHIAYTFGANLSAQSAPINKISASDFTRKFITSGLLVGQLLWPCSKAEHVRNCQEMTTEHIAENSFYVIFVPKK